MGSSLITTLSLIYVGGLASYVIGRRLKRTAGIVSALTIGASLLLYLLLYGEVTRGEPEYAPYGIRYIEHHPWVHIENILSISVAFYLDGLNYTVGLIILIVSFLAAIYSIEYIKEREYESAYFMLYNFYAGGMIGAVISLDLIQFLFFWEAMLIPSYILIGIWGYGNRRQIAFKYLLYTQLGTILLIVSFAIIGVYTKGSFLLLEAINASVSIPDWIKIVLLTFMLIGFGVKMAIVPLHGWLPDAHAEAPTPISVILSGVMIEVGLYALIRIALPMVYSYWTGDFYSITLVALALVTMIYGGIMALVQDDVKRMLAYSSISQMGYMFLGVAVASSTSIHGSVFHIVGHGLMKGLLFMVAGVLIHEVGIRDMRKLGGLALRMPLTASLAVVGAMGIAGLPGISTFISEFMIFLGALELATPLKVLILILAVLGTALSASYMLFFIKRVFFGPLSPEFSEHNDPNLTMLIPMILMALIGIALGVYPKPILDLIAESRIPW